MGSFNAAINQQPPVARNREMSSADTEWTKGWDIGRMHTGMHTRAEKVRYCLLCVWVEDPTALGKRRMRGKKSKFWRRTPAPNPETTTGRER